MALDLLEPIDPEKVGLTLLSLRPPTIYLNGRANEKVTILNSPHLRHNLPWLKAVYGT